MSLLQKGPDDLAQSAEPSHVATCELQLQALFPVVYDRHVATVPAGEAISISSLRTLTAR